MLTTQKPQKKKAGRPSISVSGKTYERLCVAVPSGSLASFIDGIVVAALDDPTITARMIDLCRSASP